MKFRSFQKRFSFAVALCLSFSFLPAQGWELGLQSGSWGLFGTESNGILNEFGLSTERTKTGIIGGSIFLHKEKGKRYLQLNFNSLYVHERESIVGQQNLAVGMQVDRSKRLNGHIGVEMGRKFAVGKRIRLMLGGEIGLGQTLLLQQRTRSTFNLFPQGDYTIKKADGPGWTSLTGRLVGRIDYRLGSRYRLGLAFTYGGSLNYGEGLNNAEEMTFNSDGILLSTREEFGFNERSFGFSNLGLSQPLFSLSILLKKPE